MEYEHEKQYIKAWRQEKKHNKKQESRRRMWVMEKIHISSS